MFCNFVAVHLRHFCSIIRSAFQHSVTVIVASQFLRGARSRGPSFLAPMFFLFADFVTYLNFYNSIAYISLTTADTNMVFPQKVWQDSRLHFGRKNFRKIFRLSGFLGQKYKKFTCNNLVQWYSTRLTCKRLKVRTRMPPIFFDQIVGVPKLSPSQRCSSGVAVRDAD